MYLPDLLFIHVWYKLNTSERSGSGSSSTSFFEYALSTNEENSQTRVSFGINSSANRPVPCILLGPVLVFTRSMLCLGPGSNWRPLRLQRSALNQLSYPGDFTGLYHTKICFSLPQL